MDEDSDDEDKERNNEIATVSPAGLNRLGKIITDLRKKVPVSAEAPSEVISIPKTEEVSQLYPYPNFMITLKRSSSV